MCVLSPPDVTWGNYVQSRVTARKTRAARLTVELSEAIGLAFRGLSALFIVEIDHALEPCIQSTLMRLDGMAKSNFTIV